MDKRNLMYAAQRIFNRPLAIRQSEGEIFSAMFLDRARSGRDFAAAVADGGDDEYGQVKQDYREFGYEIVKKVAVIEISGTLVNKNGYLVPDCGMTGYDGIRQNFIHAMENPDIKAIVLDIDSGGGEVSGCFDLCDTIYESRGQGKLIAAILSDSAYSAAYALASACDIVTVPETGGVGSVGVICMHMDYSRALEQMGMRPTVIQFGAQKSFGSPYSPLEKEAMEKAQKDVNEMGEKFVQLVARNRGISSDVVRATEAGTFLGEEGVDLGFADELLSPHLAFTKLLNTIN